MNRSELKVAAKQQIKGNIGIYFVCMLVVAVLSSIIPGLAGLLLAPPLTLGMAAIALGMTNGDKADISTLFNGFQKFGPAVLLNILIAVFTMLWSMLFIIPGIIKAISYSMSYFILSENDDMTALEALNESKRITQGRKGDLFVLYLSFIPWFLLCMITFGLAYIYVGPYMQTTLANYYNKIKDTTKEA